MKEQLISESTKYGLAMMVLVLALIACGYIIIKLWDQLKKNQRDLLELTRENTIAFQKLESTISMLVAVMKS